jgi:deazaflavin-dependent oxidoreductase (nitroreductase family)
MIGASARAALETDLAIDITTTGRRSGEPRRLEIWFYKVEDRIYITGWPGRRDWYANLLACPDFTFHLKQSVRADIPARARPVTAAADREQVLRQIIERIGRLDALDEWLESAPLVEVEFPGT